ncbi:MAG: DUF4388 domain-containing protein [Planctomycetes bacterium]|nr:DUF4388 domain-containing protein [Planctomycetota bacterium]
MQSVQKPDHAPAALADLVKECTSLCQSAEAALGHLPPERESFLSTNLGDVLTQLTLVLRMVGQEPGENKKSKEERKSFLRKLFNRSQVQEEHPLGAPRFDVSRQGLQGNSSTVAIPELLSFLSFGRKTGVLWLDTPEENFLIGLVDGHVMHGTSDHSPEGMRLGEVLVGLGYLTRRQLERFLEKKGESKETVSGEFLVKNDMISEEELKSALRHQIQQLVHRMLASKAAIFRFREGMEVLLAHRVNIDINQLLLESARVHDEATNTGLRSGAAARTWESWQGELSAEVTAATGATPLPASAVAAPLGEKVAESQPQPAATASSGETRPLEKSG